VETFLIISGRNVLPAAPSPGPSETLRPDVRHGVGPAGEELLDDGLVCVVGLAGEELAELDPPDPSPELESDLEPHPVRSSASPPRSTPTVREVFVTLASIAAQDPDPCVEPPELGRGRGAVRPTREGVP
jgi:hypothetical protein